MATSGSSSFNIDLTEYVEEAFERAGGEMRTGYHLRTARRSMNLLFADWANRGVNMWTFEQDFIPLVQGQMTYALPEDTVDLLDHVIRNNANSQSTQADLTITRISVSTYATIPNKLTQGRPIQVWVQRLTGSSSLLAATVQTDVQPTDTTIAVNSVAGLPNSGFIQLTNSSTTELIFYNGIQLPDTNPVSDTNPAYLLQCARGQNGTGISNFGAGNPILLVQQPSITVWPTPNASNTYQFVYWRMRRIQDAGGNGAYTMDVPFRFIPCLVAGLAYYIALKIPEGISRLEILKQQYDEAWQNAANEDQDRSAVRFVPRQMFIGGGV
jgi:hypothetical protein